MEKLKEGHFYRLEWEDAAVIVEIIKHRHGQEYTVTDYAVLFGDTTICVKWAYTQRDEDKVEYLGTDTSAFVEHLL